MTEAPGLSGEVLLKAIISDIDGVLLHGGTATPGAAGFVASLGDNMETDIIAGTQKGMRTALVLTGVSGREDVARYAYRPHHVLEHVGELVGLLASEPAKA